MANERFSGRGHRIHLCKDCIRLPKGEIKRAGELREIEGFLRQSHISDKNRKRLAELTLCEDEEVSQKARLVEQVAAVYPYKRRRLKKLARTHRELVRQLEKAGLIFPWTFPEYIEDSYDEAWESNAEMFSDPAEVSRLTTRDFADDNDIPF